MNAWGLPITAVIGAVTYSLNTDYRDVLDILQRLGNMDDPEYIRWSVALALFFEEGVPKGDQAEAMQYLATFINGGESSDAHAKREPKKLDWQQDAGMIVADINKVAGCEIRALPYMHWWTFLAYFNAIGEGQLSTVVSIRDKLRRGRKLEKWEQEYYRENKARVDLKQSYSAEELAEQARLNALLGE